MSEAVFTASELAAATGGKWSQKVSDDIRWEICTDSRNIASGECFIPIVGERFDGHSFLPQLPPDCVALKNRSAAVNAFIPLLEVEDITKAYQQIARFHRLRMKNLKIAGVTGSVGKTSVKEMLRAIFTEAAGEDAVIYTLGNTNNQIGVPQNLLRLTGKTRYAVIEMGTNHHGEIAPLAATALPDAAIVNTIAACHLENLGDLNGVAKEKSAIWSSMHGLENCAIYPAECAGQEILAKAAEKFTVRTFGMNGKGDVSSEYLGGSLNGSRIRLTVAKLNKSIELDWGLTGEHQAANAAAATAAALDLGLELDLIARGLSNTTLPGKRMNSVEVNQCTWINDSYNANPQSMKSSLRCIAENTAKNQQLLLVLGDMLELGADEIMYHREVLRFTHELFAGHNAELFLLGKRFAQAASAESSVLKTTVFGSLEDLQNVLKTAGKPGMIIFLKSSNGTGLSKVEPC